MLIVCSWLYGQSPLEELIYFLDNLLRPLLSILLYVILVEKIDTLFRYLLTVSFNLSSQYISHIMSIDGLITSFEKQVLANASDREIKIVLTSYNTKEIEDNCGIIRFLDHRIILRYIQKERNSLYLELIGEK